MSVDATLHEAIRENIGRSSSERLGEVTALMIRRYALTIGDPNPIYHDPEQARAAGHADIVAPPNMLTSIIDWGVGHPGEELNTDGTRSEHLPGVDTTGVRVMGGGESMHFHRSVVAGCSVTLHTTLTDATMRDGRTGPMIVLEYRNEYRDEQDRPLLTCDRTMLLR